jgi:cytochrome oxidase Cu insertion factor (SCO1/SenC/PrrC family)
VARLVIAVAAVALFLLAYQWGNQYKYGGTEPPAIGGVLLRPPRPLPDFMLTDSGGQPFERKALVDQWSLLAVGDLSGSSGHRAFARLIEVYNRLADQRDLRRRFLLLLVTADSAPALARDFERLSPAIAVLSGDRAAVADFTQAALGASPDALMSGDQTNTTNLDDGPSLFLIDPEARVLALFPGAQPAEDIAADLRSLIRDQGRRSAASGQPERGSQGSGERQ